MGTGPTLDYASPPSMPRPRPYWTILIAAWVASTPVVNVLDHAIKRFVYGGPADGTGTILAMLAGLVPALILAACLRRRWWVAAIVGGLCSPVAIAAMYAFWQ